MLSTSASAVDHVVYRDDGEERTVSGKVVVTAKDGGLLLLTRDSALQAIEPKDLVKHTTDDEKFVPFSTSEIDERLLAELPAGFRTHKTAHYVICHNTSRAYAQWCGGLFERLYWAFGNFWTRKGLKLHDPDFPLVAVVFADRASYARYAQGELGEASGSVIGYYSLRSNRMNMVDLTGVAGLRRPGDRRRSSAQINAMLSRPQATQTVATVIHEATHQLAFNRGLQTRYADIPLWISEGIAVYFETPDLRSSKGWRTIGKVNRARLATFRKYAARRPSDSLVTLLSNDDRFRNSKSAGVAYAETWALNFFLINQREKQFLAYLRGLSEKSQLVWDTPEERLDEFRRAFGDLDELDADFLRAARKFL